MKKSETLFGGIIIGAAVGAALGLLFAPTSGKKTRKKLEKNMHDLEENLKQKTSENLEHAKKEWNQKLEYYTDAGKKMVEDLKQQMHLS